ncbi:MAG: PAS domain-containing protein [Planctomycetota bacterium]
MEATDPYRELFERAPDAILIMEGDRFTDCNPAAVRMLGFSDREALLAKRAADRGAADFGSGCLADSLERNEMKSEPRSRGRSQP